MKLIKSAFWLTVAFMLIGPGAGNSASMTDMAGHALQSGRHMVEGSLQSVDCQSIECIGGKAAISAGLDAIPVPDPELGNGVDAPFPLPRLVRQG